MTEWNDESDDLLDDRICQLQSPIAQEPELQAAEDQLPVKKSTELYVGGTMVPRYLAANGDCIIAIVLALMAGSQMPANEFLQLGAMTAAWLGYYFVTEALFSSTPAKRLAGLVVLQVNGKRITTSQAFVRTLIRLFEANPFFALPAALSIIFSPRRQRIGDKVAGTIVASVKEMRRLGKRPNLEEDSDDRLEG